MKNTYTVSVLGFDQTEKIVLASIFGLAARRSPKFVQAAGAATTPDIYLIDANDPEAIARFKNMNADRRVPSILIGDSDQGTGWPVLKRPLQWTRLFKAFDLAVTLPPTQRPTAPRPQQPAAGASGPLPSHVSASAPTMRITPGSSMHGGQAPAPAATPRPAAAPAMTRPPVAAPAMTRPPATPPARLATGQFTGPLTNTQRFDPGKTGVHAAQAEPDNVMVVDDSPAVREFMRSRLEPFSFRVDYAGSGEEAIGLTASKQYTCIFLDVIMPGIDGYQVCKMIKSRKAIRPTAVVMLTSKSSPFDKIRGTMAGCDAYLTKPVDEERLLEVISKFLPTAA
jgi:twitching motility two-component system response regulator PilG